MGIVEQALAYGRQAVPACEMPRVFDRSDPTLFDYTKLILFGYVFSPSFDDRESRAFARSRRPSPETGLLLHVGPTSRVDDFKDWIASLSPNFHR